MNGLSNSCLNEAPKAYNYESVAKDVMEHIFALPNEEQGKCIANIITAFNDRRKAIIKEVEYQMNERRIEMDAIRENTVQSLDLFRKILEGGIL